MAKIGVFDLCSFFWTVAGTRKRGEDPYGLALQVLRYVRSCAEKIGVEDVIFGADGPSGRSFRRAVCADYKASREAKDPEQRAELDALTKALLDAGFTVTSTALGPDLLAWFEGDDVVASFALTILKDPSAEVCIGSNDWDLAPLLAFPKVRLFTTRGEERLAEHVKKEFGVEPLMLPQLKALAGDSDGYKPFPGLEKGKPGIGDKTAAAILEKFGSAEAAVKAALEPDTVAAPKFGTLSHRVISLLRTGGEAALAMGLTCAKLRTDVPVPVEIGFGEWEDVERALLGRQKTQQSEPRPEVVAPPPDAAKGFQEAAHAQLAGTVARVEVSGRIGEFAGEGAVPDLTGRSRDPEGSGMAETVERLPETDLARTCGDGAKPVCPRCLGVEPGMPAGNPDHLHPGPFTAEVCAECFLATRASGERPSDRPIAVTPISIGRPIEALAEPYAKGDGPPFMAGTDMRDAGGIAAIEEARAAAPRRRRSSKVVPDPIGAGAIAIEQNFAGADPDKVAAAFKEGIEKAAEKREARPEPDLPDLSPEDLEADARGRAWTPPEPKVFVLLTEAEFIALTPLPALSAAGLLTPPEVYAGNFAALLDALRDGAFRPSSGVFIGSVPEACDAGISGIGAVASSVLNGLEVLQSWRAFVDQLHVLPRFTDLAKYGGKLVRA